MAEFQFSKKGAILSALGLVIVMAVVLGFWLWRKNSGSKTASNTANIDDIRSAFAPPASVATPVPSPVAVATSSPSAISPRGPDASASAGIPSIGTAVESYKNISLGFETEIDPGLWQPTERLDVNQVVFANASGQIYNIESLQNTGDSLDVIAQQLKGSPSVWNLVSTTFEGEPALKFDTGGAYRHGLAVMHNGRLFYILGPDLVSGPLLNFSFL